MQILHPLGAIEGGLGRGIANSLERRFAGEGDAIAQQLGKQRALIKTAFALARGVERHGNDHIESAPAESCVIERGKKPARHEMPEVDLAMIFKLQHDLANDSAAAISRDSGIEMQCAMGAVTTSEDRANGSATLFLAPVS